MLCSLTEPPECFGYDDSPGRTTLYTRYTRVAMTAGLVVLFFAVLVGAISAVSPVGFCGGCHAMRSYAESYEISEHAGAGCVACHAPSTVDRLGMGWRVTVEMLPRAVIAGRSVSGPAQGMPEDGCRSCHDRDIDELVDRAGIKILHSVCASESSCVNCHGAVAHGDAVRVRRVFTMESCTACHQRAKATLACDSCHSAHTQGERLERGPWQVTHGSQWAKTHGLGSLQSCGVCHPADYCVRCHGTALPHPIGFGQSHGEEALRDLDACVACHETETLCTPCHGVEMPHPDGFLKVHSSKASTVEDQTCVRCHDSEECTACHVRHIHPGNAVKPPRAGE